MDTKVKAALAVVGAASLAIGIKVLTTTPAGGTPPPADICTGNYFYQDACDGQWQVGWPGIGPGGPGCMDAQGCSNHAVMARGESGRAFYIVGQGPGGTRWSAPPQATDPSAYACWKACYIDRPPQPGGQYTSCLLGPVGGVQDPPLRPLSVVTGPMKAAWMAQFHCNVPTVPAPTVTAAPVPTPGGYNVLAPWVEQLAAEGITAGCGPGIFCPKATLTREQAAVWMLKLKHGSSYVPPPCVGKFSDVPCAPSAPVLTRPVVRLTTPVAFQQAFLVPMP